ncbi:hypothetical protein NQ318_009187 [Aromia moschata]|uniref:DUF4817 domain-containing protein n=1 Tax=Aromia moschata TaxID=1265417 RepID=A0AAV8Y5I5_9CUCU|nr:hypothetical protein NQ318_009187 [Aromia moschata]
MEATLEGIEICKNRKGRVQYSVLGAILTVPALKQVFIPDTIASPNQGGKYTTPYPRVNDEDVVMIGYGDRTRTQAEVVRLFQEKYPELPPISQGTVSKIEKQFRERGHVRHLKKNPPNKLSDDQKLDFVKLACLWITEVIHVLVRCAQLKELLLLPKVCVKTQEPQLVTEHNNLINRCQSLPGIPVICDLVVQVKDIVLGLNTYEWQSHLHKISPESSEIIPRFPVPQEKLAIYIFKWNTH